MHSNPTRPKRALLVLLVTVLLVAGGLLGLASVMRKPARPPAAVVEVLSGDQIYQKHCASCHGAKGEGAKEYPEPLVGDRSLEKLATYIDKKMPQGHPGLLGPKQSMDVAKFIFDAFYSKAARARHQPLRIELSRLTVVQYRTSVADLLGMFMTPPAPDERRGLRMEIFNGGRRFRDDKRVVDKIVPILNFENRGHYPPAENVALEEYSVRWSGGFFVPETGDYEIILETRNGARLWINDDATPLIDGWVRSGDNVVLKETIPLLGGRVYPLRIEIFKEKREKGVAALLKWKAPHRAEELVPERLLRPGKFNETCVVRTPFPPDDRSMGYERGTSISKAWDEATTDAAFEVASAMAPRLAKSDPQGRARKLVERAFRRPLTPEQVQFFVDRFFAQTKDPEAALKSVILLALKSPRFLYLTSDTGDAYDAAARLSLALWDSLPDAPLLEAAKAGTLDAAKEAERMLADPRAKAKVYAFYHRLLQMDRFHDLAKDPARYPGFDAAIVSDLRTSLDLFLDEVTWGPTSDFRQLLLADYVYLNGRLAKFYGAELPENAPFQKVTLDPKKHAGLLTHPLLMAGFSYTSVSSPIHRGVFLARALLGRRLKPPPDAVAPIPPELHPSLSTRERILLQTKGANCQSCHAMINPLGFALENFDAVGRFREVEKEKPINAQGSYWTLGGEEIKFNGARELGEFLVKSEETHEAFVEHLFHYLVNQPILAYGLDLPLVLRERFEKDGFNIRKLMIQEAAAAARLGVVQDIREENAMMDRRDFLRNLGLSAGALPFVLGLPSLHAIPRKAARKQRLVIMFSPDGVVPWNFWPDEEGETFTLKESLTPLAPFQKKMMTLKGLNNKLKGDGDGHMRGIGCLLTGIELFPGNIQGGSDTPAGWAKGISIDQEIKNVLQSKPETRTRFGSLEFGVLVPERADTWTRMVYAGPNKPIAPISNPHQMFKKFYGSEKDKQTIASVLDAVREDLKKMSEKASAEDRNLLEEHATFVREMEKELTTVPKDKAAAPPPAPDSSLKEENDSIPKLSKQQIDLMVNSFTQDFARIATIQYTQSVGGAKMRWLGITEGQHELSHKPDKDEAAQAALTKINKWYAEQLAYLAKRLEETPEPDGQGSMLDNTLIVWTNELGQGNSHTRNNIPFVLVGGGLDFKMGRALNAKGVPHNRFLMSLAHGFGHRIEKFGNPELSAGGPISILT